MADGVTHSLKGFDQYEMLLGDELRGERATIGKSLLDVQRDLKIKASYIAAIENCDIEVFSNQGFIAGYVRSYARYLSLDPEIVYERFCNESGFSNSNSALTWKVKQKETGFHKNFGPESTWKPGIIGQVEQKPMILSDILSRIAPALLVLVVLTGSIWGAMSVLKQVQRLDIVAFEEAPEIFPEPEINLTNSQFLELSDDIYSSEELALPVFEPRDRALSTLEPNLLTALEDKATLPIIKYSQLNPISEHTIVKEVLGSKYSNVIVPEPVVRTVPFIPNVKILAMTPAWVRVKNENGDVIFEKILKEQETYLIKKELFKGELRAGNAQNVYFLMDGQALGPLSKDKSVVKRISLDPNNIRKEFLISTTVGDSYKRKNQSHTILDTAGIIE